MVLDPIAPAQMLRAVIVADQFRTVALHSTVLRSESKKVQEDAFPPLGVALIVNGTSHWILEGREM